MATKEKSPTTLRLDKQTKEEARQVFAEMGMDFTTGINIYINQVARDHKLPFTPSAVDPLDAATEQALADMAAGRMTDYKDFEAYQRAMDKLSTTTK
ncbi:type II toxin-antitoxin system RelB/DinJ family antitoxin [Lacticaseibacillus jixianensis]|uniref:Type II toxin-antitoxin system RelB/DinJ family antitoxin n=1 Tax=Lacticaseibacillus jixianensis TaxID=2486012 RepID=A0ABW4B9Z2_9LACO|nr:type II toxin-antitoxin system RelB/DinJ family antitoxin [Lacticaseibacillus jixianensis]